jgi:hypothetical protein
MSTKSGLTKYNHISSGYKEVMKSSGIRAVLDDYAVKVADSANDMSTTKNASYKALNSQVGNVRARGVVTASNYEGRIDNYYHNTLQKALFGTKG